MAARGLTGIRGLVAEPVVAWGCPPATHNHVGRTMEAGGGA